MTRKSQTDTDGRQSLPNKEEAKRDITFNHEDFF